MARSLMRAFLLLPLCASLAFADSYGTALPSVPGGYITNAMAALSAGLTQMTNLNNSISNYMVSISNYSVGISNGIASYSINSSNNAIAYSIGASNNSIAYSIGASNNAIAYSLGVSNNAFNGRTTISNAIASNVTSTNFNLIGVNTANFPTSSIPAGASGVTNAAIVLWRGILRVVATNRAVNGWMQYTNFSNGQAGWAPLTP